MRVVSFFLHRRAARRPVVCTLWATSFGTKVPTIVSLSTIFQAQQGRYRLKLRHLNFEPYPSRTRTRPRVSFVATHATMRMSLF